VLGSAGEVGVDFEAVEVADDQQRRVFEVFAVLEELFVGGGEVFVFAFVFPAEVAAHPDVGPALAAFGFVDAAFEGVPGAVGVGGGRFGLAQQVAEVAEVLLVGAALGERGGLPFLDEFLGRQRWDWGLGNRVEGKGTGTFCSADCAKGASPRVSEKARERGCPHPNPLPKGEGIAPFSNGRRVGDEGLFKEQTRTAHYHRDERQEHDHIGQRAMALDG
jgi:hypothetical protein